MFIYIIYTIRHAYKQNYIRHVTKREKQNKNNVITESEEKTIEDEEEEEKLSL